MKILTSTSRIFHGSFARRNHYLGKPVIDRIGGNTQKIYSTFTGWMINHLPGEARGAEGLKG